MTKGLPAIRPTSPSGFRTMPASVREIHAALRRDIVSLRLTPGERLSENELAMRFGTSRTPVREALIRLVEEEMIEVLPQRGSFVRRISLKAVERARFVREALEVAVARSAAANGISEETARNLRVALARQRDAGGDAARFTEADDDFHAALADGIGQSSVWGVIEREKAQFDRLRFLSLPAITPVDTLIAQHEAIFKAVLDGDIAAAEARMREHLSEVLKITHGLAASRPDLIQADD
ncbi:GntR family transcriptional regulator [Mesorhizobium sp. ESP7-2]|uniref:GntR family transcriptional regulator n=1 Tax=Mesorhizobium sp. ESP7-2 TaxID=2876622 RepID=UPI001CCD3F8C|nr:GntR family transcriptional regulator [Mesorhizobium sp. ESP7-2]MBZ9708867.1 GntR family transcriptional regulator [Mesorhizobium sp. ESP7-2]